MSGDALVMGAVAYDPKVVTIWDGFRAWLRGRGLDFDYVCTRTTSARSTSCCRAASTRHGTRHWRGSGRNAPAPQQVFPWKR